MIALDRQERGQDTRSAVEEVQDIFDIPVFSILTLADLIQYLGGCADQGELLESMRTYRSRYGV